MADANSRLVFSTGTGRVCPGCGAPPQSCRCGRATAAEPPPRRIVATLRMEKKGRGGKTVTVVGGLPENPAFLADLSRELKRVCGTGGTVLDGAVQLQGDQRERIRQLLLAKGFVVKG